MSPDLEPLLDRLHETLEAQAEGLARLASVLASHRTAFVALRADRVLEGIAEPTTIVEQLRHLDAARQALSRQVGALLGIHREQPTLSQIAARVEGPWRQRLERISAKLQPALRAVRVETIVGNRLLRLSEEANTAIVAAIAGQPRRGQTYDRDARRARNSAGGGTLVSGTA